MYTDNYFNRFELAPEVAEALKKCKCIAYAETKEELQEMAYGPTHTSRYDVVYPIEGLGTVKEAEVVRCKNGCVVNFMEDYMRRRDPNSMAIGDELPTDKPRFKDRFGYEFSKLRQETLDWLSNQQIVMLPFYAGPNGHGYPSLMICPMNAAFFALSLANMQGFVSIADVPEHYKPRAIIYVAPPFRHTHFDGKQVVVHNRSAELHEVWAYNLYPGPSAKKGACFRCCSTSASTRAGSAAIRAPRWSRRRTKTRSCSCTRVRPAAARAKCSRTSTARTTTACSSARTRSRAKNII